MVESAGNSQFWYLSSKNLASKLTWLNYHESFKFHHLLYFLSHIKYVRGVESAPLVTRSKPTAAAVAAAAALWPLKHPAQWW